MTSKCQFVSVKSYYGTNEKKKFMDMTSSQEERMARFMQYQMWVWYPFWEPTPMAGALQKENMSPRFSVLGVV